MKFNLGGLGRLARKLKLARQVDSVRFNIQKAKNRKKNRNSYKIHIQLL